MRELHEQRRPRALGLAGGVADADPVAGVGFVDRVVAEADLVVEAGDAVEARQRRHQHLTRRGHPLQQVGPLVEIDAVLDRVDPLEDRELGAGEPLRVRGGPVALAMRLLDERRDLLPRHLGRIGILQLDAARARRHHLDEVGAAAQLLADRAAHVVGTVGLTVHPGEPPPAGRRGGDDRAAGQQTRSAERAVAHRLACLEHDVVVGTDVADGRDPAAQRLTQVGREEVGARVGQQRLGARVGLGQLRPDVRVGVDQPGHQRAPVELDHLRVRGRLFAGRRDRLDHAVADEHGGARDGRPIRCRRTGRRRSATACRRREAVRRAELAGAVASGRRRY